MEVLINNAHEYISLSTYVGLYRPLYVQRTSLCIQAIDLFSVRVLNRNIYIYIVSTYNLRVIYIYFVIYIS